MASALFNSKAEHLLQIMLEGMTASLLIETSGNLGLQQSSNFAMCTHPILQFEEQAVGALSHCGFGKHQF